MYSKISGILFLSALFSGLLACKTPENSLFDENIVSNKLKLIVQNIAAHNEIKEDDLSNHFDTRNKKPLPRVFPKSYVLLARKNSQNPIAEAWIQPSTQENTGAPLNRVDILLKETSAGEKCISIHSFANEFELSIQPPNPLHREPNKSLPVVATGSVSGHRIIATTEGFSGNCLREISIFFVE